MLQARQEELERRADEISAILKTFNNKTSGPSCMNLPLQQKQPSSEDENLHVDSVCDLPVQMRQDGGASTSKMHMDLFKPNNQLIDSPTRTADLSDKPVVDGNNL